MKINKLLKTLKIDNLFTINKIEKKIDFNYTVYEDELCKLLFNKDGVILNESLENFINSKFDNKIEFVKTVSIQGGMYQKEISSFLFTLLTSSDSVINRLNIQDKSFNNVLDGLNTCISKIYEAYKGYIINLIHFQIDNPGLSHVLNRYPRIMYIEPFFNYIENNQVLSIDEDNKTLLYLGLIEVLVPQDKKEEKEQVTSRFLQLNEADRKDIRRNLSKFKRSENITISKMAKRIYPKLSNRSYKFKLPDHLIYYSSISDVKAQELAEFTIRYFENETSLNSLKQIYQGNTWSNTNSTTLMIKHKKVGKVSFIFDHLIAKGHIESTDKYWSKIAEHKILKVYNKENKSVNYVTSSLLSKSLSDEKTSKAVNQIELDQLKLFLKVNFPKK